jgi:hypothetical protein
VSSTDPRVSPETVWEIDVPLLSNRIMVGGVARAFGIAALIMGSLLTLLFAVQGEFDAVGPLWLLTAAVCGGMLIVAVLVMLFVFRNRIRFRFTVTDQAVLAETIDTRARGVNRLTTIAGILGGSPGATGAGLIGASQESQSVDFSGAFGVQYLPRSRVIAFRNSWRRVLYVYCTAENYAEVAERIASAMEVHATDSRLPTSSPLPRYLGYSALVVLCCVPAFLTVAAFDVSLLIPLLMLCFGLAMIWFVGAFGLVVVVTVLLELGAISLDALGRTESFFEPGRTFARWTVYSGDDWALIALTVAGAAVLTWLSVRAVTGRLRSLLDADLADMSGE